VDYHAQRPVIGGTDYVTLTPLRIAVQEDKQIDHNRHDREPDPTASFRNEPPFETDEAPNPENLTAYKDQEQD
jgi:hypothetical protein